MLNKITIAESDCELPASSEKGRKLERIKSEVAGLLAFY